MQGLVIITPPIGGTGTVTGGSGGTTGLTLTGTVTLTLGGTLNWAAVNKTGALTSDIPDSAGFRYCTDAQKTVIGNTSGTNTGDQTVPANTTSSATLFFNAYNSGTGAYTKTQPAFTDLSGSATAAQLPNPSATTIGGVQSIAAVGSKWINAISTSGVPAATQPTFTDLAAHPTTIAGYGITDTTLTPLLGTSTVRGLVNAVWLSIRTDGHAGTGTAEDPYDASGTNFDTLLGNAAKLPANTNIQLAPGTYTVTPVNPFVNPNVLPGWKIFGAGVDVTTIQCRTGVALSATALTCLGSSTTTGANGFEVFDLTVDSNWAGIANNATDGAAVSRAPSANPITDAVTNGTATVTSATAAFNANDLYRRITGTNMPANAWVGVINSATSIGISSTPTTNTPVNATGSGTVSLTLKDKNFKINGISCSGSNIKYERVKAINSYGSLSNSQEIFDLYLSGGTARGINNWAIDCDAQLPWGDYGSSYAIFFTQDSGVVNSRGTGRTNGLNGGYTTGGVNLADIINVLIDGNTFTDEGQIAYQDTLNIVGLKVTNNRMIRGAGGVFLNMSGLTATNVEITNNTIGLQNRNLGGSQFGIGMSSGGTYNSVVVSGNDITWDSTGAGGTPNAFLINLQGVNGCHVLNNHSDNPASQSNTVSGSNIINRNNTYFSGAAMSGIPDTTRIFTAGTTALAPLQLTSGTNLTSPVAGAIEYDGVNPYFTTETTAGRGAILSEQYFHLTAAGGAITTIANFFGTTSNPVLVSGAYYIIDAYMWFLSSSTGTVVWTLTNSAAPTGQNILFEMSPAAGLVAPPGTATLLVGQIYNDATAAKALVATAALGAAANYYTHIKMWIKNGTGTSLKIQATCSSGNITPGINSYWHCRRMSPNNIGTFAA